MKAKEEGKGNQTRVKCGREERCLECRPGEQTPVLSTVHL